jgi:hypothetical protein
MDTLAAAGLPIERKVKKNIQNGKIKQKVLHKPVMETVGQRKQKQSRGQVANSMGMAGSTMATPES